MTHSLLHRLAWFSRARLRPSAETEDLQAILWASRQNNRRDDITGALLLRDGLFAQILEGRLAMLEAAFERIQLDQRHEQARVLYIQPITERRFRGWDMAYAGVGPKLASPLGTALLGEIEALYARRDEWAAEG
jgi:hypothetical protein